MDIVRFLLSGLIIVLTGSAHGSPHITNLKDLQLLDQLDNIDNAELALANNFNPCENLDTFDEFLKACDSGHKHAEKEVYCSPELKLKLELLLQDCHSLDNFDYESIVGHQGVSISKNAPAAFFSHGHHHDSDECEDEGDDCDLDKNKSHRKICCPPLKCVREKRGRDEGKCVRKSPGGRPSKPGTGNKPKPNKPRPRPPADTPSDIEPPCGEKYCNLTLPCCRGDCHIDEHGVHTCKGILDLFPRPTLPSGGGGVPTPGTGTASPVVFPAPPGFPGIGPGGAGNAPVQSDPPSPSPPPAPTTITTKRPRPNRPKPAAASTTPEETETVPEFSTEVPIIQGSTSAANEHGDYGDDEDYDYIDELPNGGVGVTEPMGDLPTAHEEPK